MRRGPGSDRGPAGPSVDHRWVDDDAGLAAVVRSLLDTDRYAVDTEFHRERTYWPQLALVQIAWEDDLVLIDPLQPDWQELLWSAPIGDGAITSMTLKIVEIVVDRRNPSEVRGAQDRVRQLKGGKKPRAAR